MTTHRFATVVVIVVSGLIADGGLNKALGQSPAKPANPAKGDDRPEKPDFKVTAEGISKEAFADQKAAATKYKGKWVELEGEVEFVQGYNTKDGFSIKGGKKDEKDFIGYMIVTKVLPTESEKVWSLSAKQKVSVFAYVHDHGGFLVLTKATVKELEASKIQKLKADEVAAEYAKDGKAAEEKYITNGKISEDVILSGTVADLTSDKGFKYVVLEGSGKTQPRAIFNQKDWATLKKGDKVTIRGGLSTFDAKTANSPQLDSGFLIKKD